MTLSLPAAQGIVAPAYLQAKIACTFFPSKVEPRGERMDGTLGELLAKLREPEPNTIAKDDLLLWSPATFIGDYRLKANVQGAWAIGFDVDVQAPGRDALLEVLAGRAGFFHSSSRHTEAAPRWRLFLFLSRLVNADEYAFLWDALSRAMPFHVTIGQEAKDASRQWFVPREPEVGAFVFETFDGALVNVDALLASAPKAPERKEATPRELADDAYEPTDLALENAARMVGPLFRAGERHAMSLELAGACAHSGVKQERATAFLRRVAALGPEGNEDASKREKTVADTYAKFAAGAEVSGWPKLRERIGPTADIARRVFMNTDWVPQWSVASNDVRPTPKTAEHDSFRVEYGGLDGEDEQIDWLVDGLIPRGSVTMFAAEAYSLKTFAAIDIAIAVAHGAPWLGHATKEGPVLYVNFEMSKQEMKRRFRLLEDEGGRVGRVTHPDHALDSEEFWKEIETRRPSLVIVDTLFAGNPEVEEKDPRAARPLIRAARVASETGTTFVFIHHSVKDTSASKKNRVRGSGAIYGACDTTYFFSVEGKNEALVECIKMRSGPEPEPFRIKLSDEAGIERIDETRHELAGAGAPPSNIESQIRLCVAKEPIGKTRLVEAVRGKKETKRATVNAMIEEGHLVELEGKLYLDNATRRRERVMVQLARASNHVLFTTLADLATAASVSVKFLKELERTDAIAKTSKNGHYTTNQGTPRG